MSFERFADPVSFLQITLTSNRYNITLIILVEEFEISALLKNLTCVEDISSVPDKFLELLDLWDSLGLSSENDFHLVVVVRGFCE
mgnify:CR=1 FL=1